MIVTIPTGSQMDRILRCPASAALPQVHDANPQDGRDRGTAMHKFLERVPAVGRDAALAEVDEAWRGYCAEIELAKLAGVMSLSHEVAVAYNWRDDSARLLQPLEHRAYEVDPTCEIPLTVDVAGFAERTVYVGDFKSGHGWLPEPTQSMQLGLGALALARVHGALSAVIEYVRIRDDGTSRRWSASLDAFGLDAAAARVAATMQIVEQLRGEVAAGVVPNVVEGPHCRYCPAQFHCPAKTSRMRLILADPKPIPYSAPITPENASHVYAKWKLAKETLAQVEAALHAYGKLTPIPVCTDDDGSARFFGEQMWPGNEELDGRVTHTVLAEMYGGEVANAAVTMEVTKVAITDAIRKARPAGDKITPLAEQVYELVRKRGGARRKPSTTTREFTVAPDGTVKARKRKAS